MESLNSNFTDETNRIQAGMLVELLVDDLEMISEIKKHPAGAERTKYLLQSLKIGFLALKQARGEIDIEQIRRTGEHLVEQLQEKFEQHNRSLNDRIASQLKEYFDPHSGRLNERLQRLLKKDGELELTLNNLIGQENSELVRTLSKHIGAESPLIRNFDPERSDSLPSWIRQIVEKELNTQRDSLMTQFSLDNKEGAMSRFLSELVHRQGQLSGELNERVNLAIKEFSLDHEDSAMNKLLCNIKNTQETLTAEFSLNEENSALSRLKQLLDETQKSIHQQLSLDDELSPLSRIKKELMGLMKEQHESSQKFQQEVHLTLEGLKIRRDEARKGTQHGIEFEETVTGFLTEQADKLGDVCLPTSTEVGMIQRCKTGDCVIELGAESIAPGEKIVIEAKQMQGYTFKKAREEIEEARKNRTAQIGVFVFSKRTAPSRQEPLKRINNDIYVVWDNEDPLTDPYLHAGYMLARALCIKTSQLNNEDARDFTQIEKSMLEIERRAQQLDDIFTWSNTIKNNAEKIQSSSQSIRQSLVKEIDTLREKVNELKPAQE